MQNLQTDSHQPDTYLVNVPQKTTANKRSRRLFTGNNSQSGSVPEPSNINVCLLGTLVAVGLRYQPQAAISLVSLRPGTSVHVIPNPPLNSFPFFFFFFPQCVLSWAEILLYHSCNSRVVLFTQKCLKGAKLMSHLQHQHMSWGLNNWPQTLLYMNLLPVKLLISCICNVLNEQQDVQTLSRGMVPGSELTVAHHRLLDCEPLVGQSCSKRSIANQFNMKWQYEGSHGLQ